jgi:hypothetical protein
LLAPRPTPKLEDHPSSDVCGCLFNLFTATLHIGGSSYIRNLRTCHAVVTGTHIHGFLKLPPTLNLHQTRATFPYKINETFRLGDNILILAESTLPNLKLLYRIHYNKCNGVQ